MLSRLCLPLAIAFAWRLGDLSASDYYQVPSLTDSNTAPQDHLAYLEHKYPNPETRDLNEILSGLEEDEYDSMLDDVSNWERVKYTPRDELVAVLKGAQVKSTLDHGRILAESGSPMIFTMNQLEALLGVLSVDPPNLLFTVSTNIFDTFPFGIFRDIASHYLGNPVYKKIFAALKKIMGDTMKRRNGRSKGGGGGNDNSSDDATGSASLKGLGALMNYTKLANDELQSANRQIDPRGVMDLQRIYLAAKKLIDTSESARISSKSGSTSGAPLDVDMEDEDSDEEDGLFIPSWKSSVDEPEEEGEDWPLSPTANPYNLFNLCDWYKHPTACHHAFDVACLYEMVKRWKGKRRDFSLFPHLTIGTIALPRRPVRALKAIIDVACNPWVEYLHADVMLHAHKTDIIEYYALASEVNGLRKKNAPVNDPNYKDQWHIPDQKIDKAWDLTKGDESVVIMIADTGIKTDHEDLKGNLWQNPETSREYKNQDKHGINAISKNGDLTDSGGHGTHMSGIAAAHTNNKLGCAGVGYKAKLAGCKFMGGSSGQLSALADCVNYAVEKKMKVVSMSLGGDADLPAFHKAMKSAAKKNLAVVCASGDGSKDNDSSPTYPSNYATMNDMSVISVGAYTKDGTWLKAASYGKKSVLVAAPGNLISATSYNGAYELRVGTSPAAPSIAGIIALGMSANKQLTAVKAKQLLQQSVEPLDECKGKTAWGGHVNAETFVKKAQSG